MTIRMGGRRSTFVLRFDQPVAWVALGVAELRRFHAVIGRHLRMREGEQFKPAAELEQAEVEPS